MSDEVEKVAAYITGLAKNIQGQKSHPETCLLFAGGPVIKVKGLGLGGRNQHLALLAAQQIKDSSSITTLSAGTDGPTDTTGAVCDSNTFLNVERMGLDPGRYVQDCNSYYFFKEAGGLILTGPTQTNVIDLMIALIE